MKEQESDAKVVFLQGRRVYLRPILRKDIPNIVRWINNTEVTRFLATYLPMMEADEEQWLDDLPKKKVTDLVFVIVVAEGDRAIGVMGLHKINGKDRTATTGAIIGEKEYWGKGYGTEAKMLLLHYAFNTLNLRKICSSFISFNRRSHAYQLKCGYVEEGRLRRQIYRNGRYWDEVLMAVFKKDWLPLWRKYKREYLS